MALTDIQKDIREELGSALDRADAYLRRAPADLVGVLAIDQTGTPVEVMDLAQEGIDYRRATRESEIAPDLPEAVPDWRMP
jgi:hypothetical protein